MTCDPLTLDEGQQVGVDGRGLGGRHAMRKALVGLQRAILQKLRRQRTGIGVRNDLVVVAMHHQHRHRDLLQILGEIGLRKGDDAVIMGFGAAHHALPPPVQDNGLRRLRAGPIVAVERIEGDRQHVAVEPLRCLLDPGHKLRIAAFGRRASTTCAACTNSVRKYLLPRLEILPRIVRSPVDSCFGTRPSQAPKSRPCVNPAPLPIAATTELEMIGPTPGTVITRWQASSCSASDSISADTAAMRSSSRRQSWISSALRLTILGDSAPVFKLRMSGSALRNGPTPCRTVMPRSIRKPRI